jgi:hypothetical protein
VAGLTVAGWTITCLEGGGHQVTHLDDDTGDETMAGDFRSEVSVEEVIGAVLANAEAGDWIIDPHGAPMVVGIAARRDSGKQ